MSLKRTNSDLLFSKAQTLMPGGVNSPVRAFKNVGNNPIFFKSAKGPILKDEDGNNYIDFIGSWGPMILGHSNPIIINAVKKQDPNLLTSTIDASVESHIMGFMAEKSRETNQIIPIQLK